MYFTRADIFGIHEKIWLSCCRDRKPPDQKEEKKMPLGRPAPCRANFFFDEISLKVKALKNLSKQVDLERKMKVPKKREIIA